VHPSGKYLISCSDDKSIRVWDLKSGRNIRSVFNAHANFTTCVAAHSKIVVSGGADNVIKLWMS
jgi:platelet-activating factor acetylhydrolase IB subunit alpha